LPLCFTRGFGKLWGSKAIDVSLLLVGKKLSNLLTDRGGQEPEPDRDVLVNPKYSSTPRSGRRESSPVSHK
jgi:hypothetical protein